MAEIPATRRQGLVDRNLVILLTLWLLTASLNAYIIVPASVFPVIIEDLAISEVAAGWLLSIMFAGQVVSSVPTGIGLDRGNNTLGVAVATGLALFIFVTGWQAASTGQFGLLLATRVVGGFCFVLLWNAATNIVGHIYSVERRATATGIFTSSAPAGFAIGQFTGPVISDLWGWSVIFVAYGLPALVGYSGFRLAVSGVSVDHDGSNTPDFGRFGTALTDGSVWFVAAIGFMAISLYVFVNSWMPTFLVEKRGVSLGNSGLLIGLFAVGGILSRSGGGWVSDLVFGGRRRPVLLITFGVSTPLILGLTQLRSLVPILVAIAFAGFFVQLATGIFFAHIHDIVDEEVTGTSIALLTGLVNIGAFLTPILAGFLIGRFNFSAGFAYALLIGTLGFALSLRLPD